MHYNISTIDQLLSYAVPDIEKMIIDYLLGLKLSGLSSGYINLNFYAIKYFYFLNGVRVDKEKVGKFRTESKKKKVDIGYTTPKLKNYLICRILE